MPLDDLIQKGRHFTLANRGFSDEDLTDPINLSKVVDRADAKMIQKNIDNNALYRQFKGLEIPALENLITIIVNRQIELGVVEEQMREQTVHKMMEDCKKAPNTSVTVLTSNHGYSIKQIDRKGSKFTKFLTNFTFENIRNIILSDNTEALFVDMRLDNKYKKNIMLDSVHQTNQDQFYKKIKAQNNKAYMECSHQEFNLLTSYIATEAKATVEMKDYTGLFKDQDSGLYYFIARGTNSTFTYIPPMQLTKPISALVQVSGKHHLENHTMVPNVLSDDTWHQAAKEMFELVPHSLSSNKSLIMLAWFFASLISPWLDQEKGLNLPLLFLYGQPGSGKTSNLNLTASYFGNIENKDVSMASTKQPIRFAMTSSNAFPVVSKEYTDNKTTNDLLKLLFDRDYYKRGQVDDRNDIFQLHAPWVMQANMQCTNDAVQDRMIQLLIQKSDQNLQGSKIQEAILRKKENQIFIQGYLPYLINSQDKWEQYFQSATENMKAFEGEQYGSRQYNNLMVMMVGLEMIRDLQQHLSLPLIQPQQVESTLRMLVASKKDNQSLDVHLEFLEFLQEFHTTSDFSEMYQCRDGKVFFHQAQVLQKFEKQQQGRKKPYNKNILLNGLKNTDGVTVSKTAKLFDVNTKCVIIQPQQLEEATENLLMAELWSTEEPINISVRQLLEEVQSEKDILTHH